MGWTKSKEPIKFEFKKKGDSLTGKLIDCKPTQFESKVYSIIDEDSNPIYFFGCYKLDSMLPALVGKFIKITYKGQTKIGKGQTLREYDISVWSDDEGKAPKGFDDDVPF